MKSQTINAKEIFSYFKVNVLKGFRFRILTRKLLDPNYGSEFENWSNIESMIGSPNHMVRKSLGMHKILLKNPRLKAGWQLWRIFKTLGDLFDPILMSI